MDTVDVNSDFIFRRIQSIEWWL